MIFRDVLEDLYLNKRVRIALDKRWQSNNITIGKSDSQFITATVSRLEACSIQPTDIYLLLKDVEAVGDNYSMSIKNMILNGGFNKVLLQLDTDITVIRDEKLTQLLQ